jgi:hypothetical protein
MQLSCFIYHRDESLVAGVKREIQELNSEIARLEREWRHGVWELQVSKDQLHRHLQLT